jgi:hypothetical protein
VPPRRLEHLALRAASCAAPQLDGGRRVQHAAGARGLHSFTSQLNLSAFNGIGVARRGCVARVKGVLGGVWGVFVRQQGLRLS